MAEQLSAAELVSTYVGKRAYVRFGSLNVKVIINDVKFSYGKLRYNITPAEGTGTSWVETVEITEDTNK